MPNYTEQERRLRWEEQQQREEDEARFKELNGDDDVATRDELDDIDDMMNPNREEGDEE